MAQGHEVSTQQYASSKHIGKVAAVMDLLDNYWFFHSSIFTTRNMIMPQKQVVVHASSSSQAQTQAQLEKKSSKQRGRGDSSSAVQEAATCSFLNLSSSTRRPPQLIECFFPSSQQEHKSSETATPAAALLLRNMPTEYLPVHPREKYPTAALPCYTKLRHSMSALDTYQSTTTTTPTPSSSSSSNSSKNSTTFTNLISSGAAGDRPPRHIIKLEKTDSSSCSRYSTIRHYIAREAYYRKTFKEKKWRSLGDLDYIEIQGLKDLGFVLNKEGRQIINSETSTTARDIDVMRPYDILAQRSAPPMFRWVNRKSADDMKDQLRFWAKAVASNTCKLHEGSF